MKIPSQLSGLASGFGKNLDLERQLQWLNDMLAPLELELEERNSTGAESSVAFILGPPRSGTTLVSQLVQQSQGFGTITNLTARLWKAPMIGLLLAASLNLHRAHGSLEFRSTRGMTEKPWEPHEFGYFWSRWFDLGQNTHQLDAEMRKKVDRAGLIRAVGAMSSMFGLPLAFKNNTWFAFQADLLADFFPKSVFVACRRDAYFVAQSIWKQRVELYGDVTRWWSVRPPDYEEIIELPPIEQVARQAVSIEIATNESLAKIQRCRVVDADYRRVTSEPRRVVGEIADAVRLNGGSVSVLLDRLPAQFESTNRVRLDPGIANELRDAVEGWQRKLSRAPP